MSLRVVKFLQRQWSRKFDFYHPPPSRLFFHFSRFLKSNVHSPNPSTLFRVNSSAFSLVILQSDPIRISKYPPSYSFVSQIKLLYIILFSSSYICLSHNPHLVLCLFPLTSVSVSVSLTLYLVYAITSFFFALFLRLGCTFDVNLLNCFLFFFSRSSSPSPSLSPFSFLFSFLSPPRSFSRRSFVSQTDSYMLSSVQ